MQTFTALSEQGRARHGMCELTHGMVEERHGKSIGLAWKRHAICESAFNVFMLNFTEIVTLLVVETNTYYHWCMDSLDTGPSPQPDVSDTEMIVFLAMAGNTNGTLLTRPNVKFLM